MCTHTHTHRDYCILFWGQTFKGPVPTSTSHHFNSMHAIVTLFKRFMKDPLDLQKTKTSRDGWAKVSLRNGFSSFVLPAQEARALEEASWALQRCESYSGLGWQEANNHGSSESSSHCLGLSLRLWWTCLTDKWSQTERRGKGENRVRRQFLGC